MTGSLIGRGVSRHSVGSVRRKVILAAVVIIAMIGAGIFASPAMADSAGTTAVDGTVTDDASITVDDANTVSVDITSGNIEVDRGDVASIPIDLTGTDSAWITIGDVNADGVRAIVEVSDGNDDGTVTLQANTANLFDASSPPRQKFWTADKSDFVATVWHNHSYADPVPVGDNDARSYDIRAGSSWNGAEGQVGGATDRSVMRVFQGNTAVSLPSVITVDRGGIASIPVNVTGTESAWVTVGDLDNDGVRTIVRVDDGNDDGTVTLKANTYNLFDASAQNRAKFWTAAESDSVAAVWHNNSFGNSLPVGDGDVRRYDIQVGTRWNGSSGALDGETDQTVLRVVQRRTNGLTAWSAPANTDLDSLTEIRTARDTGTLTRSGPVENRTVVAAINASGLTGAMHAAAGETPADRFATLVDSDVVRFEAARTMANNPAPRSIGLDLGANGTRVIVDRENDTVFVVMEPDAREFTGGVILEFGVPSESGLSTNDDRSVRAVLESSTAESLRPDPSGPIAVENATVVRGDVATIPITVGDLDRAIVRLGSEYAGWKRVVRVADRDDDGRIDLRLNTYTAGDADPREAISAVGPDRVVDVLNRSNTFDRALGAGQDGHFEYRVSAHEGYDVASGTGTGDHGAGWLRVDQRSTDGIAIHSAPRSLAGELTSGAAIRSIDDGRVVSSLFVGQDLILVELEATGLQGALRAANGSNTTTKFLNATDGDPATFEVETPPPFVGGDRTVDLTPAMVRVVPDRETGHYYVFLDAETFDGGLADGDRYRSRLSVSADSPLSTGTDRTVETPFVYRDPATVNESAIVTFDERSYAPISNQTVSGMTTLPPGTELTISVTSNIGPDVETAFLTESTAVVAPDGSWSTTVDLSEGVDGLGFTIDVVAPHHAVGSTDDVIGESTRDGSVTPDRTTLPRELTTLSGTSTFESGTHVTLSLASSRSNRTTIYGATLRAVETTIGPDGAWSAEVNLSGLDPGRYQLRVAGNGTVATADYRVGDVPDPEPIAVRNYRRSSAPTDELQPSEIMRAKADYVLGDISLESAVTVMRAYFFD